MAIETRSLVHDLDQRLSRVEGKVDALEERLSRVEGKVDGLCRDMATLGEGIDHLSQNVTAVLRALPRIPGIPTPNAAQA